VPEVKRKSVKEVIVGQYRVIYRIKRDEVAVLTVRHSRQRLKRADFGG
jgi:mRNA-degrading endonuclease RelE of RelBE toxin-antitoxin system